MKPHNPDKLSPEAVGPGYRLLDETEIYPGQPTTAIEAWNNEWFYDKHVGSSTTITYRTKLSPRDLLIARSKFSAPTAPPVLETKSQSNLVPLCLFILFLILSFLFGVAFAIL